MAVPFTFGSATAAIPLSQLDTNFATTITLGNTAIQLGNTVTTLNNMTLANVAISSGNVTVTNANLTSITTTSDSYISGLRVGKGAGAVNGNTAVGASALAGNTTGSDNTGIGFSALAAQTTGTGNTALGLRAAYLGTAFTNVVAIGANALAANTASDNTAVGTGAAAANTSGANNTVVGRAAFATNTTGGSNTAIGHQSLQANTTASNNTAVGYQAGYSTTTGGVSVFIGNTAGYSATTATGSTFVGQNAGYSVTTGVQNTFIGHNTDGTAAGYYVTTGAKNVIIGGYNGNQGGLDIRGLNNYIVLSDGDGNPRFSSAIGNAYIGSSPASVATLSLTGSGGGGYISGARNALYLKNVNASGNQSNVITFGSAGTANSVELMNDVNANGTTINQLNIFAGGTGGVYLASGGTSWTAVSDERTKDIIEPITDALAKVSTLRTVIGKYKTDAEDRRRVFLIAQDVQAVLPEAVTVGTDELNTIGLSYADTIPLLVAAIKELKAEFDAYKATHP